MCFNSRNFMCCASSGHQIAADISTPSRSCSTLASAASVPGGGSTGSPLCRIRARGLTGLLLRREKDGMIERILRPQPGGRHNSNEYRLTGLIAGAEPLAKEEIAKRAEGKTYRKARAVKKGRGLVSVVKP